MLRWSAYATVDGGGCDSRRFEREIQHHNESHKVTSEDERNPIDFKLLFFFFRFHSLIYRSVRIYTLFFSRNCSAATESCRCVAFARVTGSSAADKTGTYVAVPKTVRPPSPSRLRLVMYCNNNYYNNHYNYYCYWYLPPDEYNS